MKMNLLLGRGRRATQSPNGDISSFHQTTSSHQAPHSPSAPARWEPLSRGWSAFRSGRPRAPSASASIRRSKPPSGTTGAGRRARASARSPSSSGIFVLSDDERDAVVRHQGSLPLGITPYYASLMSRDDALEPLRRTHIPVGTEYLKTPGEADDPLGEDGHTRRARPRAPLSGPRAVPRHRLLLDLLPLLHALPHGRRAGRRILLQPPAMGGGARLHRRASRNSRRADLGRRSADACPTSGSTICSGACAPSAMSSSCGSAPRCRWCCPCASPAR